jgi:hypothetical protein
MFLNLRWTWPILEPGQTHSHSHASDHHRYPARPANGYGSNGIEFIVFDKRTRRYHLNADRFTIDLAEFDAAEPAAALAENDEEKATHRARAVSLYAGNLADLLEIDTFEELSTQYRDAVRRACQHLAEHYDSQGDTAHADTYRRTERELQGSLLEYSARSKGGNANPGVLLERG